MTFEFDNLKSASNKEKHGIDFHQAQKLWLDPERIVVPARTLKEARFLMIAMLNDIYWSAIYTIRGDVIRIISVRKSRYYEKKIYNS